MNTRAGFCPVDAYFITRNAKAHVVHHLAGPRQAAGELHVVPRRRGIAARVGVEEDQALGTVQEGLAQDGPRLHGRAGEGATVDLGLGQEVIPAV